MIIEAVLAYLYHRTRRRHFLVTPVDADCHWGVSKQPDGSYVTRVAVNCTVSNRSSQPIRIIKARVITPKITGTQLRGRMVVSAQAANVRGAPHRTANYIGPGQTLPVSCTLETRGVPRQKSGTMHAEIEIEDANGRRERVKLLLTPFGARAA